MAEGLVREGNIDLLRRPKVRNADGSISTVRSMSINTPDGEILIPTVSDDGKILSDEDAVKLYEKSGKHLGIFANADLATKYAKSLHDAQEKQYMGTDSVKESPTTGLTGDALLWLSKQLREKLPKGVASMKRNAPILGSLAEGVAQPALESVARGLENYAYGDKFFSGKANAPIIGSRQEDMLAALPAAGAGTVASKAMLVPASVVRHKAIVDAAERMHQAGDTPEAIWAKTGLLRNPRRPKDIETKWLSELDDSAAAISPTIPRMSEALRKQTIAQLEPVRRHSAELRTRNLDLPEPGTYAFGDLVRHPELLSNFPELQNTPVRVINDLKEPSRGSYSPTTGRITLNTARFFDTPTVGGNRGVLGTALHEATHGLQVNYDMPRGASPELFIREPDTWQIAAEALRKMRSDMPEETARHWRMTLDTQNKTPFENYVATPGERFAVAAQERLGFNPYQRAANIPTGGRPLDQVPDPEFANSVLGAADHIRMNPSIDPSEILDWLYTWKQAR